MKRVKSILESSDYARIPQYKIEEVVEGQCVLERPRLMSSEEILSPIAMPLELASDNVEYPIRDMRDSFAQMDSLETQIKNN